jgi:hypothetical protein
MRCVFVELRAAGGGRREAAMGIWRKIMRAVLYNDGTGSMYSGLIGAPLNFDPPHDAKPSMGKMAEKPNSSPSPKK